jgi:hypothetical protein
MSVNQPFTQCPNSILFNVKLSPLARLLYAALVDFTGSHDKCWPGEKALAAKIGCSKRWVQSLLRELVEAGLLAVKHRTGYTSEYFLLVKVERENYPANRTARPPRNPYAAKPYPDNNNHERGASRPFSGYSGKKKGPQEAGFVAYARRHGIM